MILFNKQILKFGTIYLLYFALLLLFLTTVTINQGQSSWFLFLYFDNFFVFLITPAFLIGSAMIEKTNMTIVVVRMKSRTHAFVSQLTQQYIFAFLYLSIWFSLYLIFSVILFSPITDIDIIDIVSIYLKYFLEFIILFSISMIFSRSDQRIIRDFSYMITFSLFAFEIMTVYPRISNFFSHRLYFLFSWIYCRDPLSYLILLIIIVILTGYLFLISARKDIF